MIHSVWLEPDNVSKLDHIEADNMSLRRRKPAFCVVKDDDAKHRQHVTPCEWRCAHDIDSVGERKFGTYDTWEGFSNSQANGPTFLLSHSIKSQDYEQLEVVEVLVNSLLYAVYHEYSGSG